MPATFSASTCIDSTSASLGPFNIYLDNSYSTPFSSATLTQLTNCPFVIVVPTGTTTLYFKDTIKNFCFTTPIQDNNICSNCKLGLSNYSATTTSRLYCGFLTGSCQNITDYVIHWYGPNDTTTLAKRTGFGSVFQTEYDILHPFLGTSSIPLPEGIYTPVIQKVIVSGLTFSNTGGTGNVLFSGSCLPTTNVQPLTCLNRTNTRTEYWLSGYNHNLKFSSTSQGAPQSVSSTYVISANTKFIAWRFQGKSIPDTFKLSFSGSNYGGNILGLDNFVIGTSGNTNSFIPSLISKSATTPNYFTKITCLTGLTVNNGDKIIIDVIPAQSNTDWDLFMTCLDSYNCNSCLYTNPYKIIGSTITGITGSCQTYVKFSVSACSLNTLYNEDYFKYYNVPDSGGYVPYQIIERTLSPNNGSTWYNIYSTDSNNQLPYNSNPLFYYNSKECTNTYIYTPLGQSLCQTDINDTRYNKTQLTDGTNRGVFGVTGSSTVISTYYNSWVSAINYSNGLGYSTNNTNLGYYRFFYMQFPSNPHPHNCGDGSNKTSLQIHPSSTVLTGTTSTGNYFFNITANTITSAYTISNCDINCSARINTVLGVNSISTGTTTAYNQYFSANTSFGWYGIYYSNPFETLWFVTASTTTFSAQTIGLIAQTNEWSTNTYPYSGTSPSIIPSYSGTVCNYKNLGRKLSTYGSSYNESYLCLYTILFPNSADTRNFEIWSAPIVNYSANTNFNNAILAYRYSGGNITYSSSTYIIG